MVWGKKIGWVATSFAESGQAPDQIISEMLSAYQQHFYDHAKGHPDPSIAEAQELR